MHICRQGNFAETVNTLVSEMQSKEGVNEMVVAVWITLPRGVMSLWGGLATGRVNGDDFTAS